MASRNIRAAVYVLFVVAFVAVQVSLNHGETASADVNDGVCGLNPNPNKTLLKWPKVKKTRKGVCAIGSTPVCEECPLHTSKKKKGWQQECQSCAVGSGTVDTGNKKCYDFCAEGKFFNISAFSEDYSPESACKKGLFKNCPKGECQDCPIGTYMPVKCLKTKCIPCPNGKTTAATRTKKLEDCGYWCPAGQQGNDTLQDCEPCPEGTYKEEAGLGMCLSCGDRYTTMTDGASNKTRDCVRKCDPGKEYVVGDGDEAGSCAKCSAGTFKAEPGNRAGCQPCGLNKNSEKGATSCEVECSEGWGTDGKGGCEMCDYGWYKPTQSNDNCTQCGMAGIVRKSTKERGSVNKASCIKLDSCVRYAVKDIRDYYDGVATMNDDGGMPDNANIVTFMKDMCFDKLSVTINAIVDAYRTCEDLHQLALSDITIGSRKYKGDVQKALFQEAATHGNGTLHYCNYFRCMKPHMEEFEKCKSKMEVDPDTELEFCSPQWRAGAKCTMLNVKNCPPLRYHPDVTEDARLRGVDVEDVYSELKIQALCDGGASAGTNQY